MKKNQWLRKARETKGTDEVEGHELAATFIIHVPTFFPTLPPNMEVVCYYLTTFDGIIFLALDVYLTQSFSHPRSHQMRTQQCWTSSILWYTLEFKKTNLIPSLHTTQLATNHHQTHLVMWSIYHPALLCGHDASSLPVKTNKCRICIV